MMERGRECYCGMVLMLIGFFSVVVAIGKSSDSYVPVALVGWVIGVIGFALYFDGIKKYRSGDESP